MTLGIIRHYGKGAVTSSSFLSFPYQVNDCFTYEWATNGGNNQLNVEEVGTDTTTSTNTQESIFMPMGELFKKLARDKNRRFSV